MEEIQLKVRAMERALMKYGKYIEELEKDVAILKANSHPKKDFVVCENCNCKIKEK